MREVALAKRHEEADPFNAWNVKGQGLDFLMVKQIHILFPDFREVVDAFDFHRLGFDPFAVLPVAALRGHFANVDLRVEVRRKRIAVVARIAVEDIDVLDFVEVMFQGIRGKYAGYAWVKAAAQQCGDAGLLKALAVFPLPLVFEFRGIFRLIVRRIHVVRLGCQAGVHDRQILIRQSQVHHHVRFNFVDQRDQFVDVVGIDLRRRDFRLAAVQLRFQCVAFRLRAAGNADFLKNLAVLNTFVDGYSSDAAAADDQCFSHFSIS
ncbi:hypothetical protein D3C81_1084020 [compost metagenome]